MRSRIRSVGWHGIMLSAAMLSANILLADGNVEVNTKLAKRYFKNENYALAMNYAEKGDQSDPELLGMLGAMYFHGLGTPNGTQMIVEGTNFWYKAISKGDVESCLSLFEDYLAPNGLYDEGYRVLLLAAEKNESIACRLIGDLIVHGHVKGDAGKWYRRAALESEDSVPEDWNSYGVWLLLQGAESEALKYLKKASDAKLAKASLAMGKYYYRLEDYAKAEFYCKKCVLDADSKSHEYCEGISTLANVFYKKGEPRSAIDLYLKIGRDESLPKEYRSATLFNTAELYRLGWGMDHPNFALAKQLYKQAALLGKSDGWAQIGWMCECKQIDNPGDAIGYYVKAAKDGSSMGMVYLASGYFKKGHMDKAKEWSERALEANACRPEAYLYLSVISDHKGDVESAKRYLLLGIACCNKYRLWDFGRLYLCAQDYIGRGYLKESDIAPFQVYLKSVMENADNLDNLAKSDTTGFLDVLKNTYLMYNSETESKNDEIWESYLSAANKGNNVAIHKVAVGLTRDVSRLSERDKHKLRDMLLSANKNAIDYAPIARIYMMYSGELWEKNDEVEQWLMYNDSDFFNLICAVRSLDKAIGATTSKERLQNFVEMRTFCEKVSPESEEYEYVPFYLTLCDLFQGENSSAAVQRLEVYAAKGNAAAMFFLCVAYADGRGCKQDIEKARAMLELFESRQHELRGTPYELEIVDIRSRIERLREMLNNVSAKNNAVLHGQYPHEWTIPSGMVRGVLEICVSPVDAFRGLVTKPFTHLFGAVDLIERVGAGVADICTFGWAGNKLYGISRDFEIWPWGCNCVGCKAYWYEKNIGGR